TCCSSSSVLCSLAEVTRLGGAEDETSTVRLASVSLHQKKQSRGSQTHPKQSGLGRGSCHFQHFLWKVGHEAQPLKASPRACCRMALDWMSEENLSVELPRGGMQPSPSATVDDVGGFAPLVNSLNFGIASPLLLGPPPLQLAQIKTQLALQHLTSVATNGSAPPHAWLNQAFLKGAMFSPRGTLPQRPRGPNPAGTKPPGSFRGGGAAGLPRKPAPGTPQGTSQRFPGQDTFQWTGSQRIKVRVTLHRADPRQVKEKTNLHQEKKGEPRPSHWDSSPCSAGTTGQKPPASARVSEQNSNAQNRYTPESASSILASFGLSNEDLEELSRYPDDQLTPENMPLILREIRIRKMGHSLSGAHTQSRGEETAAGASGAAVKSKVIDYGHASKYGYSEDPLEVRPYNPEVLTEEPLEGFQREQNISVGVPPSSVACNPVFPVEDIIKQTGFQNDSSNTRSFFPTETTGKVSGLCATPAGLPVVKSVSQPAVPPVMPPIMPPIMPPLVQPMMPPVMLPLVQQPMAQHVVPPMSHPPFSAGLLAAISRHERTQQELGTSHSNAQSGSGAGQKPFQPQAEEPIKSPFGIVKASWLPVFPQSSDAQKIKRFPTPSMMNDYYATSPRIFPHMCSLCNTECTHMKDWILHQNTPSHIESCRQLRQQYPDWNPESYSSKRNAGDRKENQTPKRRSNSASPSPRRSRATGSSYVLRRSRSRSRSPGRFRPTRPRSRSPRQMRRLSPRHREDVWKYEEATENECFLKGVEEKPALFARLLREELLSCGTVLQISDLPDDGFSDKDIKKIVQPFGKVNDLLVLRSRHEAFLEMSYKEAVIAAVKYSETVPVLVNGKRVKISVAEKPKASPGQLKKKTQSTKKVASTKSPDEDTQISAEAEAEGGETKLSDPEAVTEGDGVAEPVKAVEAQAEGVTAPAPGLGNSGTIMPFELDDACVVLISNLPEKGYSAEEVSNLAKPFGGLNDVLLVSSHKKAYIEINRKAADSMVKFYTCFPMSLDGNQLCISMEPQYDTVKDEEAIFTGIIKESDPKVNTENVHHRFVHLGNLPDDGYRELEAVCVGLRFGKVDNYVVLKNKNKAILQLDSAKSAKSMYSFLKQYPYNMGEHTLTCSLSPSGDSAEADGVKKEVKKEEPSKGSVAKKGPVSVSPVKDEISAAQTEPSKSRLEGAGRKKAGREPAPSPAATAAQTVGAGVEATVASVKSADTGSSEVKSEEAPPPPSSVEKEEAVKANTDPELLKSEEAPPPPSSVEKEEAVKANTDPELCEPAAASAPEKDIQEKEKKPVLKTAAAGKKKLDVAGADPERKPEEPVLKAGRAAEESPEKPLAKAGAEAEKNVEKHVPKVGAAGENAASAASENKASLIKAHHIKATGPAKTGDTCKAATVNSSLPVRESPSAGKMMLKAVVSLPDISKSRAPVRRNEPALCKGAEQKAPPKPETQGQAAVEKKISPKEEDHPRPGGGRPGLGDSSGRCEASRSSAADGKGGDGRNPARQEADGRVEARASSKQAQEGESRSSSVKKDNGSNKASPGGNTKTSKSDGSSSAKPKEEEELFPFNLDEFVTVDEVVEEMESPVKIRRNPPRGKRKEGPKTNSAEPSSKRRKGKSCVARLAESELSFVTLDEIGEEEEVTAHDPQGLVVVDEVMEEEELLSEAVKDPRSLVTLDEIPAQGSLGSQKDAAGSVFEEQDLKAEPLVTVDEIGEVEELPLNEPTDLNIEDVLKQKEGDRVTAEDAGDCASSQVPDDPSALVTVDEIQEDNEDNPLVTLDEVNEDEDDFLADFNRLKEEQNFVTVDEVGEEDEEEERPEEEEIAAIVGPEEEDIVAVAGPEEEEIAAIAGPEEEDIVAVAGPEEMEILGDTSPEEEIIAVSKSKGQLGSGDKEPESKRKKTASSDVSKAQSTPKDLDYLVPKAGFFCQICSLFYADETSVKNHCRTPLHQQNMQKFMAKQKDEDNGGEEERSSR
ncbi:PREDICTED: zinc finger protein 638, partial [Chlamydotis macqueenii]|uniref:zinc finger protein 638 n=1 Tax=Chlamydotis macqueenii TaxID=187382 RepID=UPI000529C7C0